MIGATEPGGLDLAGLYRDHHRDVFQFLYSRCGEASLAEDLTQDTFERVVRWARRNRWQERGKPPLSLLYTVARNLLYDHRKSRRYRCERPHPDLGAAADRPPVWCSEQQPVEELVTARMQTARWREVLTGAAAGLSDQQRRVLHLAFVEGLSDRDIGGRLGLHPNAVKGCRWRALQRLRGSAQLLELEAAGHHRVGGSGR